MAAKKKAARKKAGRPRTHDRASVATKVLEQIAGGDLVKDACEEHGITPKTLRQWAEDDGQLGAAYARAREEQAHSLAEQALAIATGDDELTQAREEAVEEYANEIAGNPGAAQKIHALESNIIQRDKMRVDTIKWLASKIAPRTYGERITQQVEGGDKPIQHEHRVIRWGDLEVPI